MLAPVKVTSCGLYHPYRHLGELNPQCDAASRKMMDFKDEANGGHERAINHFSQLAIDRLAPIKITGDRGRFVDWPFVVVIVPSHTEGRISPALNKVAQKIVAAYPNGSVYNCLKRMKTVPSAHKEGGDRSILGHMSSISAQGCNLHSKNVLLLDDVKTTGGSLSACFYLLKASSAGIILPLALLETATY